MTFPLAVAGPALVGLLCTLLMGLGVGCLVERVSASIKVPPPADDQATLTAWDTLLGQTTGGRAIGHLERPLFFAALWVPSLWFLLSSWLVFKLAFYWQGANFTAFPEKSPGPEDLRWLVSRRTLGTHHVATALVGTAANIVVAIVGVAVGKWVTF